MIDCSDSKRENRDSFIEFYEKENGKIKFYTRYGEFLLDDNLDNLAKIKMVMDKQACVNASFTKKRFGEFLLGIFLFPYFSYAFDSSFDVFSDSTLFNIIFFGVSVSALITDMYCVLSRGKMSSECLKDSYYVNNIDYINYHINDESVSKLFEGLDSFKDENGKLYLDMNTVDVMRLSDLIKLKIIIEQDMEDRKDEYTKKR